MIRAVATSEADASPRNDYRYVWVLMHQMNGTAFKDATPQPVGIFLTRDEAEQELQRQIATHPVKDSDWWIEPAPIAV